MTTYHHQQQQQHHVVLYSAVTPATPDGVPTRGSTSQNLESDAPAIEPPRHPNDTTNYQKRRTQKWADPTCGVRCWPACTAAGGRSPLRTSWSGPARKTVSLWTGPWTRTRIASLCPQSRPPRLLLSSSSPKASPDLCVGGCHCYFFQRQSCLSQCPHSWFVCASSSPWCSPWLSVHQADSRDQ